MVGLYLRAILILTINVTVGTSFCYWIQQGRSPERWESEGTLFFIGSNTIHNTLFMGSSRGFAFSKCPGVHQRVESELQRPILNLSTPANGVLPAKLYLEHFFARGNTTREIVYFAEAPLFLNDSFNEDMAKLEVQPFDLAFLYRCIRNNVEPERLVWYVRSKFGWDWIQFRPLRPNCETRVLESSTHTFHRQTKRRNRGLYAFGGVEPEKFELRIEYLSQMIQLANRHNARLRIVVLPTLLTSQPGKKFLATELSQFEKDGSTTTFDDFSEAMQEPKYFTDMDHMNERGCTYFAGHYLAPILGNPTDGVVKNIDGVQAIEANH